MAGLDGFGGKGGLPRDGFGHAADRAQVALHVFEIGGLADEVESAEGLPDVMGIRGKIGEWITGSDGTAVAGVEVAD